MTPFFYAKAFRKALREGVVPEDELVENLSRALMRRRQSALWPRVANLLSKELVHHYGGRWVVLETARALSDVQRKKMEAAFSKNDYIEERVRPDLIAGMRIYIDDEREFDGSLKKKLNILF